MLSEGPLRCLYPLLVQPEQGGRLTRFPRLRSDSSDADFMAKWATLPQGPISRKRSAFFFASGQMASSWTCGVGEVETATRLPLLHAPEGDGITTHPPRPTNNPTEYKNSGRPKASTLHEATGGTHPPVTPTCRCQRIGPFGVPATMVVTSGVSARANQMSTSSVLAMQRLWSTDRNLQPVARPLDDYLLS